MGCVACIEDKEEEQEEIEKFDVTNYPHQKTEDDIILWIEKSKMHTHLEDMTTTRSKSPYTKTSRTNKEK